MMRVPAKLRLGPEGGDPPGAAEAEQAPRTYGLSNLDAQASLQSGTIRRSPDFSHAPGQLGKETGLIVDPIAGDMYSKIERSGRCGWTETVDLHFDPAHCAIETGTDVEFVNPGADAQKLPTADFESLAQRYLEQSTWLDGWYAIRVTGGGKCAAPCAKTEMPIHVRIDRKKGGKQITLSKGKGREYSNQLYNSTEDWTLRHEASHAALGAADEYEESGVACREGENVNMSDWSVMADQVTWGRRSLLHPRHFSHIVHWFEQTYPACHIELVELKRPHPPDIDISLGIGAFGMGQSVGPSFDLGIRIGFGLDRLRNWALSAGPHAHMLLGLGPDSREAYLAGMRFGLERRFTPSIGGLMFGGFAELGYGHFKSTIPGTYSPVSFDSLYGMAGARLGYALEGKIGPTLSLDYSRGIPLGANPDPTGFWQLGLSATFRL